MINIQFDGEACLLNFSLSMGSAGHRVLHKWLSRMQRKEKGDERQEGEIAEGRKKMAEVRRNDTLRNPESASEMLRTNIITAVFYARLG